MIEIAAGRPIWALGLMSGTSLDGVDAAMLLTDGERIEAFGPSSARVYHAGEIMAITEIHRDWRRFRPAADTAALALLQEAEAEIVTLHAEAVAGLLARAAQDLRQAMPAVIGFHGQTVAHAPAEGWTWQLGDGGALARALNRPVVWDFRTADMAEGGQGAPLAPFYHHALARHIGATAPIAFLNIGGVANVTWVDPSREAPEEEGALIAFDTGPGNALVNDWMMARIGEDMDRDGAMAARGTPRPELLAGNWGAEYAEYLARPGPKSLDRNAFSGVVDAIGNLSVEDGAATLTGFTADCVARSLPHMPSSPERFLVCGGGRRNRTMMAMLAERLGVSVEPVEAVGLDGDMLEAQAFAWLAVRVLRGLPNSAPSTTGCASLVSGGRISLSDEAAAGARGGL